MAGAMVRLLGAALSVLLMCAGSTDHGTVIPGPQNVQLKCENQVPIVWWDYSPQSTETMFFVYITGSAGNREYKTSEHEFDLREFVWESEDQYMAYHSVTVTALVGGNRSKSVMTKSFSFNSLKSADLTSGVKGVPLFTGKLDFPPVNLTVDKSGPTVSIMNPFSFYPELKQAKKTTSASFQFSIINMTHEPKTCKVDDRICKYDFSFPDNVERCIKLEGWLMEGNEVGQVEFREMSEVCPIGPMGDYWLVGIFILAVIVFVVIVIIIIVYKTGAWTLKTAPLPEPLLLPEANSRIQERYSGLDSGAVMSRVQVVDIKDSVDSMEVEAVSPTAGCWDGTSSPESHSPPRDSFYTDRLISDSSSQEAMALMSDGQRTDDDSANGSAETESVSIYSTEEEMGEVSPYDCPHVLQIDMGDGDTVIAYTTS